MQTFWLCLIFSFSGASALLFENLWFHQAGIALGSSIWASSLVLAGFMSGIALGNALAARHGGRITRPVRAFAWLELTIGLTGTALVVGLPELAPALARLAAPFSDGGWGLQTLRFGIALALLLVPATAMGATLPLLVAALRRRNPAFGSVLGQLYGWNTLGAVVGALIGDLLLISLFGIRGSALFALGLNAIAATIALVLSRFYESDSQAERPEVGPIPRGAFALLAAAALAGFALLGLEVLWFRVLLHFVFGSGTAFAGMLAVVLLGIALGGLAGARLARSAHAGSLASVVALATGALCIASYLLFPGEERGSQLFDALELALWLMLPTALGSGALFPLMGRTLAEWVDGSSRAAGLLTLANTGGAALGPLVAGFVLLPAFGAEGALRILAALYAAVALLILFGRRDAAGRPWVFAGAAGLAIAALAIPQQTMVERHLQTILARWEKEREEQPVMTREGPIETIVYLRHEAFGEALRHRLLTNGFSMSGSGPPQQRYMRLFAHLPAALHPKPQRALLISYGVGNTADALTKIPSLERIDVVDISRDVLEANRVVYPEPGSSPLDDGRVRVHIEDGRYFLQSTEDRFDLITGEPPPPKLAGVVNLYTREYFQLLHDRLADGGIASYWLPVYSLTHDDSRAIVRGFCEVFPECSLWEGGALEWILLATRGPARALEVADLEASFADPEQRADLRAIGIERPAHFGALFLADAEQLMAFAGETPPLSDDFPKRLSDTPHHENVAAGALVPLANTRRAAERFAESSWIEGFWPESLRDETLAAFERQAAIEGLLALGERDPAVAPRLKELHRLLSETDERMLPLWILGSDERRQAAASVAREKGVVDARLEEELGIAALMDDEPEAAAAHFLRSIELDPNGPRRLVHLQLYASFLAARDDPATQRELRERVMQRVRGGASDSSFRRFVEETFGTPGE